MLINRNFRGIYANLFLSFLLFGVSMTIIGAVLPHILEEFEWSYISAGLVIGASAVSYSFASFFGGRLLNRIGYKLTMVLSLGLCALGLAFFASTHSVILNIVFNAIIGIGQGFLEPSVNSSVIKMDTEKSGRAMNLMHGAFAIGAVGGPLVLSLMLSLDVGWILLYRFLAIVIVIIAVIIAFLPFSLLPVDKSKVAHGEIRKRLIRAAPYWLGFSSILFYVGVELGISNWIAEYFAQIFFSPVAIASLTVSIFWLGILAGRFGVPALYKGSRIDLVTATCAGILAVATIALAALGSAGSVDTATLIILGSIDVFVAGLGCSIIYPSVITMVGQIFEESQNEAISFSITGGGIGISIFPFIMSWLSQTAGLTFGFAFYASLAVLNFASCMFLTTSFRRSRLRSTLNPGRM